MTEVARLEQAAEENEAAVIAIQKVERGRQSRSRTRRWLSKRTRAACRLLAFHADSNSPMAIVRWTATLLPQVVKRKKLLLKFRRYIAAVWYGRTLKIA